MNILHVKCVVLLAIEPLLLSASTWLVMAFLKELNLDPLGLAILKKLPRFNPLHFHFISLKLHVLKSINERQLIIWFYHQVFTQQIVSNPKMCFINGWNNRAMMKKKAILSKWDVRVCSKFDPLKFGMFEVWYIDVCSTSSMKWIWVWSIKEV